MNITSRARSRCLRKRTFPAERIRPEFSVRRKRRAENGGLHASCPRGFCPRNQHRPQRSHAQHRKEKVVSSWRSTAAAGPAQRNARRAYKRYGSSRAISCNTTLVGLCGSIWRQAFPRSGNLPYHITSRILMQGTGERRARTFFDGNGAKRKSRGASPRGRRHRLRCAHRVLPCISRSPRQ